MKHFPRGLVSGERAPEATDAGSSDPAPASRSRHQELHQWSRRSFLHTSGAILGAASAFGLGAREILAHGGGWGTGGLPTQIPGFSPVLKDIFGVEIPFFLPVEVDPFLGAFDPVSDPSTITNFHGSIGVVEIDGVNDASNSSDGMRRRWAADIRFMKGKYVDREGHYQDGAFGFFWLDVFEDPGLGPFDPAQVQLHDVNPGDLNDPGLPNHFPDGGVFWTRAIPEDSVELQGPWKVHFNLIGFTLLDYFTAANAILRTGPAPLPAMASAEVHWRGTGRAVRVKNPDGGFSGVYKRATAELDWHISNSDGFFFSTADSSEVNVTSAFLSKVRNGVFFDR